MDDPIRGKVARVLNSREVAINLGSEQGVRPSMYFDIVARYEDIVDPDTKESLGSIERPKIRVKITWVQEKLSLASALAREVNVGGMPLGEFSRLLMPPKWVKKYETFKTAEETGETLDEKDGLVRVGDTVVQVVPAVEEERTKRARLKALDQLTEESQTLGIGYE